MKGWFRKIRRNKWSQRQDLNVLSLGSPCIFEGGCEENGFGLFWEDERAVSASLRHIPHTNISLFFLTSHDTTSCYVTCCICVKHKCDRENDIIQQNMKKPYHLTGGTENERSKKYSRWRTGPRERRKTQLGWKRLWDPVSGMRTYIQNQGSNRENQLQLRYQLLSRRAVKSAGESTESSILRTFWALFISSKRYLR